MDFNWKQTIGKICNWVVYEGPTAQRYRRVHGKEPEVPLRNNICHNHPSKF
jgi:hypothetical protein